MAAITRLHQYAKIAVIAGACCFLGHMSNAVSAPLLGRVAIRPSLADSQVPREFIGEWHGGTSKAHNFVLTINRNKTCKIVYKSKKVEKGKIVVTQMYIVLVFDDGMRANLSYRPGANLVSADYTMPDGSTKSYILNRLQY